MSIDTARLAAAAPPEDTPFEVKKLGHVVLKVQHLERSVAFYTQVLGLRVSDVYPETMMPRGMVFLRFNTDHHGIALIGGAQDASQSQELHHLAFEVASLDDVFRARAHLRRSGVPIDFEGRRRAGCQVAVEFRDPDGHRLELYYGLDQVGTDGRVRPAAEWLGAKTLEQALANPPPGQVLHLKDPSLSE